MRRLLLLLLLLLLRSDDARGGGGGWRGDEQAYLRVNPGRESSGVIAVSRFTS